MTLILLLIIIVFFVAIFFYAKEQYLVEGFTTKPRCPDMLIQKGSRFYLYNSKLAEVPGVNPVEFNNLEDYTVFLEWQRSQGIRCPVLYLQSSYDAQGNPVYKIRPSVLEPQSGLPPSADPPIGIASSGDIIMETAGLTDTLVYPNPTLLVDATKNDPPYNKGSYPSYDQTSFYVGTTTPLDEMNFKQENAPISPDPMDPNWGGSEYTQKLIDAGYYRDNEVKMNIP